MTVWKKHHVEVNDTRGMRIGPLSLWIRRSTEEWMIAWQHDARPDEPLTDHPSPAEYSDQPPGDAKWARWAAARNELDIRVAPALPDRSVVARPVTPIKLLPKRSARVFIRIPIWVRLSVGSEVKPLYLCDIPTVELSNTWFGSPTSGELCYSLSTHASSDIPEASPVPHKAVCAVLIRNASDIEDLNFDRLCISTPHLSLYDAQGRLWTNNVKVTFKSITSISEVRYGDAPPDIAGSHSQLSKPRAPTVTALKRSFSDFQSWLYG